MMKSLTDSFVLSNGVKIPCIGYGTWQTPDGDTARDCVKAAIEAGYRHIDTATAYGNEASVGAGIKASGIKREELFVTTKHWITERGYEKSQAAIDASLKALGLDYLDLYLVHWPCVEKVNPQWKEVNAATWKAIEEAYKAGKIRAIGVSNYQKKHIEALGEYASVMPMVNQIEFHPGYTQPDNVKYAQEHGMLVEAWSPLGNGAVLSDPTLGEIAHRYFKSPAQICIKFALQNGVLPMPKSVTPSRIAQNARVFDFELSDEDMKTIAAMPELGFSKFLPEDAPADALVYGDNA